jgi:uncharacterized Tic20 family protein
MQEEPSKETRLMAAIAHGSVVVTGAGIIVGVLIWLTQKERSSYASWQAMQAAIYQLLGMVVMVFSWILWTVFFTIALIPLVRYPEIYEQSPPVIFWISMAAMLIPLAIMVLWWAYGLWAALKTWRGAQFRYLLIGGLLPAMRSVPERHAKEGEQA